MTALLAVFWVSLGFLVWTHAAYPLAASALARVRARPARKGDGLPSVTLIVAAHNEEAVIERRIENLRALDYPAELLTVVVTSDASTDKTEELAERAGARVVRNPRGGKVAAQDHAVREATSDVVAFTDANSTWAPDALRTLVRVFADPDVAYVCGRLNVQADDGRNKEGLYWRYELGVRAAESLIDSVTGGNGSIYAVRRADYVEVDPRFGHDLSLPYLMVQRGRRAVYEPDANAFEKATPTTEDEYRRKVRMFEHCWAIVLEGKMLRRLRPLYLVEILSHRHLRYASGLLHLVLLGTSIALVGHGIVYAIALGLQLGVIAAALVRRRHRALLRPRHVGDGAVALQLRAARRAGDVGDRRGHAVNRAADVAVAGTALVLASPVLALAAVAVKATSRGPALYRQVRVGRDGADFELLKLRTMVQGAETQGAGFAVDRGDPRITPVGRILRRLSLDELPQLWNVVRGDMSVIGPRPTLRYQVERYTPRQMRRLEVKPGITGWAQVHGRATLPWDERIELDVWYVEHRSPRLDVAILAKTPLALFGGTYKGPTGGWNG